MNNVLIFTIIVALLVSFVAFPMASGDNGLHKGHENYQGLGLGHEIHDCNVLCPICGGTICVPPLP